MAHNELYLVTGAAGKTGMGLTAALAARQLAVRALVRRPEQAPALMAAGAAETVVADLLDGDAIRRAVQGVRAIYYICPNLHPQEFEIARIVLAAAAAEGVAHFVYHSVLHPQVEAMPHHWLKLRVEELLFSSPVPWTILQPAAYMQNVLAYWPAIVQEGVYRVPYAVATRLGLVDLADVTAAAVRVLTEAGHAGAIYELAGAEVLTQTAVAQILSRTLGRPVCAEASDRQQWAAHARRSGLSSYTVDTLLRMFEYYEAHGFWGNPFVLHQLLGRSPRTFAEFAAGIAPLTIDD